MSENQIGSILLFILAIPLGIFAVHSWRASKERWQIIDKLLKGIESGMKEHFGGVNKKE